MNPGLSAEQGDVAAIREALLDGSVGGDIRKADYDRAIIALDRLVAALERAEQEWDEWRSLFKVEKHDREVVEQKVKELEEASE